MPGKHQEVARCASGMSNNNCLMFLELISVSGLADFRWNPVFFLGVQQKKYVTLMKCRVKARFQKSEDGEALA
jgi:hypothetical protein